MHEETMELLVKKTNADLEQSMSCDDQKAHEKAMNDVAALTKLIELEQHSQEMKKENKSNIAKNIWQSVTVLTDILKIAAPFGLAIMQYNAESRKYAQIHSNNMEALKYCTDFEQTDNFTGTPAKIIPRIFNM